MPARTHSFPLLLPLYSILLFALLYIVAAFLYPGGYYQHIQEKGFSWLHNYWCELLDAVARNGQPNRGMPVALCAMLFLCAGLGVFWYILPRKLPLQQPLSRIVSTTGILSMAILPLIGTSAHDTVINISGAFGIIAVGGLMTGLYRQRHYTLFYTGIVSLFAVVVNNYIYHTGRGIEALPLVQKVSFVLFLAWMAAINLLLYRRQKGTGRGATAISESV